MQIAKILILSGFILISISAKSQSEQIADTAKINLTIPEINEKINVNTNPKININTYPVRLFSISEINSGTDFNYKNQYLSKLFNLSKFDYSLEAYMAKTSPNLLTVQTPMSYDFNYGGYLGLSSNSFLSTFQNRKTYMLIGTIESTGGAYTVAANCLLFTPGVSVDKYRESGKSQYDANISAQLNYLLSDDITLTLFGMHSFNKDKYLLSRGMYGGRPQTYYGGKVNFDITDRFYVQTGVYGTNYSISGTRNNDFGFNGDIGYWITDRVKIAGIGQYSMKNNLGEMSQGIGMGMYPQTYYGGYLEFKLTETFGIRAGATQQFDMRKRKWVTVPYFEFVSYK
jgi:hypothetical protein